VIVAKKHKFMTTQFVDPQDCQALYSQFLDLVSDGVKSRLDEAGDISTSTLTLSHRSYLDCFRFLRARKWNISKAADMANRWADWYTTPIPGAGSTTPETILDEIEDPNEVKLSVFDTLIISSLRKFIVDCFLTPTCMKINLVVRSIGKKPAKYPHHLLR
jgi:hypothetical protein